MRANMRADVYARYERDANGCLIWTGATAPNGYGFVHYQGKQWRTHRLIWTLERGPIPPGVLICHRCDVRLCGEIGHLFPGTQLDNIHDMYSKGRQRQSAYERTAAHRARLREIRLVASAAKYGVDIPRAGDDTELPQRVPPSVPIGSPLAERVCMICGQGFLAPATIAWRYTTCSRSCSTVRRKLVMPGAR